MNVPGSSSPPDETAAAGPEVAEAGTLELTGDERLLAGLLAGESLVESAKAAGMAERTARRRVTDRDFRGRLDEGRRELMAVLAAQIVADAEFGRSVLRRIAGDTKAPPSVQASAARYLLSFAAELGPARDVEERLEELERRLGVDPRTGWKAAA